MKVICSINFVAKRVVSPLGGKPTAKKNGERFKRIDCHNLREMYAE